MKNDNKSIAFISAVNNNEMYEECKNHIAKLIIPKSYKIEIIPVYNANSLCSAYNEGMTKSNSKYKIYLHQDLMITDKNFLNIMINCFKKDKDLAILGIAGCKKIPKSGIWWDGDLVGQFYDTHDGHNEPKRHRFMVDENNVINVEALDGCILCTQFDIDWNSKLFDKWHFYDISQTYRFVIGEFSNTPKKAGVIPSRFPLITHLCGISNLKDYDTERRKFIRNYLDPHINILVGCCAGATGGVELLHQFVNKLNEIGNGRIDAKLWYMDAMEGQAYNDTTYDEYNTPFIDGLKYYTENSNPNTTLILPEIYAYKFNFNKFNNECQKVIYWESVDNYYKATPKDLVDRFPNDILHLVQSYYAYSYLTENLNIDKNNIMYVSDYLNKSFFGKKRRFKRIPQVIYNPKKDMWMNKFVNKLREKYPNIKNVRNTTLVLNLLNKLLKASIIG